MVRTLPPRRSSARHARSGNERAEENFAEPLLVIPAGLLDEIVNEALQATHATGVAIAFEKGLEFTCQSVAGVATLEIGSKINAASGLTGRIKSFSPTRTGISLSSARCLARQSG